ncbi:hypothetical protein HDZ31DRAFT_28633, partial [Schizophyllum fasciatum]
EKGGAIFKPIVKARPRAPNAHQARRETSALPGSQLASDSTPSLPSTSAASQPPLSVLPHEFPPPKPQAGIQQSGDVDASQDAVTQHAEEHSLEMPTRTTRPPMLLTTLANPRASSAAPTVISTPSRPSVLPAHDHGNTPSVISIRPPALQRSQPAPPLPLNTPAINRPPAAPRSQLPPSIETPQKQSIRVDHSASSSHLEAPRSSMLPPTIVPSQRSHGPGRANARAASPVGDDSESLHPQNTANPAESATAADQSLSPAPPGGDEEAEASSSPARRTRSRAKKASKAAVQDDASTAAPVRPKRGRKRKSEQPDGDDLPEKETRPKRKRRATTATTEEGEEKVGRKRRKKVPSFDPDADPGDEIDPTTITMAELCEDTGQGRVSSRVVEVQDSWAAWKIRSREHRARLMARKERKKLGKPEDEEAEAANPVKGAPEGDSPAKEAPVDTQQTVVAPTGDGDEDSDDDFYGNLKASEYTTQIRLGAGASIVIDEESTQVDRTADEDTSGYTHVVEHDRTKFINSGTYTKKVRGSRWSAEETDLFYDALRQYGENYELIAIMLPGRDRKSCQNKFKAEDKKNPHLINAALKNSVPIDMQTLSRITGKDFSGPTPEIRAPTPPPAPVVETSPRSSPEASRPKVKKRGRSKSALNDGVQVIGNIDDYDINAD